MGEAGEVSCLLDNDDKAEAEFRRDLFDSDAWDENRLNVEARGAIPP